MKKRLRKKLRKIEQLRRVEEWINDLRTRSQNKINFLLKQGESFANDILKIVLDEGACSESDVDFESFHSLHGAMHNYASESNRLIEHFSNGEFLGTVAYYLINDKTLKVRELQDMGAISYFEKASADEVKEGMLIPFHELIEYLNCIKNDNRIYLF
ncbi:hypothetical protein [Bacillus altitudinis]|uniref:hypothetical protein n=1 Tax=Bacillus altitudinis TaxID=293387 RepID=UPI001F60052C|nr:hypothetical protein [Bacillus altitudinis]